MYHLGSLKDEKIAKQIVERLSSMNIEASLNLHEDEFQVLIFHEKDLDVAMDVYRVSLGFPPLQFEIPEQWQEVKKLPIGAFTLNVIIVCVGLFFLKFTGAGEATFEKLMISSPKESQLFSLILAGEAWRLVTPIFLHFSFMHIIFNMLWMKDLGKIIEYEKGPIFLFFFILTTGIASNVLQYLTNGPLFGGMSGVVYGLLGFLWMKKIFNENSNFTLPKEDIVLMIGWYILCMTGIFGPIANVAHGVGLCVGMLWGIVLNWQLASFKSLKKISFIGLSIGLAALSIVIELIKNNYLI